MVASPWQRPQVLGTLVAWTSESGLDGPRMPCTPWQLTHCAALLSFLVSSSSPCLLVWYLASWSTGSFGL